MRFEIEKVYGTLFQYHFGFRILIEDTSKVKHPLRTLKGVNNVEELTMRRKKAIVTFELVDESMEEDDKEIARELLNWLQED